MYVTRVPPFKQKLSAFSISVSAPYMRGTRGEANTSGIYDVFSTQSRREGGAERPLHDLAVTRKHAARRLWETENPEGSEDFQSAVQSPPFKYESQYVD